MSLPCGRKDLDKREMGGEGLLYDPKTNKVHLLNKTALKVWNALDGETAMEDLAQEMIKEFTPPQETDIVKDIHETIARFRALSLLEE